MAPEDDRKDRYEVPPLGKNKDIPQILIQQVAERLPELLKGLKLNPGELAMILFLESQKGTANITAIHEAPFFRTKSKKIVDTTMETLEKKGYIELLGTNREEIYQLREVKEITLTKTGEKLLSGQ